MQETFLTFPLSLGSRERETHSPHWKKTVAIESKSKNPWSIDNIQKILDHPKTEVALVRLIKESKGKLLLDTFCDALAICNLYLFSKGYGVKKRTSISWDKKEFKRMAENAHELHKKVGKVLDTMDPLRKTDKRRSKGSMEVWAKGYYRDVEFGGNQLDDENILYALDIAAKFLDKMAEPNPSNRPQDIILDLLLSELENKFRKHFEDRPLYPVIADLVQATTDVLKKGNREGEVTDPPWTTARVITRLKRFHRRRGVARCA